MMLRLILNGAALLSFILFAAMFALWVRAQWVSDRFTFSNYHVYVQTDSIHWIRFSPGINEDFSWTTAPANAPTGFGMENVEWTFAGIVKTSDSVIGIDFSTWTVPFWMPLLLLLILPVWRGGVQWRALLRRRRAGQA